MNRYHAESNISYIIDKNSSYWLSLESANEVIL